MCDSWTTPEVRRQVVATTASFQTVILLPPQLAMGVDTVRVVDELQAEDGALLQQVYYRTASVETKKPGAWTSVGSSRGTAGGDAQDIDLSAVTDKMWIEIALRAKANSGNVAEGLSMIRAAATSSGRIVAARAIQVNPDVNATKSGYIPLANPLAGLGLTDVMFAVKVFGLDGSTLKFQPAWRKFLYDPQAPGSWTDLGSEQSTSTDPDTYNSGTIDLSASIGSSMYWQPGIKIPANDAVGTIQVLVAAKWG